MSVAFVQAVTVLDESTTELEFEVGISFELLGFRVQGRI